MCRRVCRILVPVLLVWCLAPPASLLRADEADDQYAVAVGHYERGRWKLATEEFLKFRRGFPNDRRQNLCSFCLGESLLQLGKFDDARGYFNEYNSREPAGQYAGEALFQSGQCAYLAGNLPAGKSDLERFLAKYPNDRWDEAALFYLGEIALAQRDAAAAAARFRDSLKRFPDGHLQDDCRVGLARALEKQGQRDEAERLYLAVAGKAKSPQADAAQFHLGALQYEAGRYPQAIESFAAFEDRLPQSPWRPNARLGHGLSLLKLNRPAEAIKQFDAVLVTAAAGDELFQRAVRGKVQAALQMKDYDALDRQAAEFERRFPASPFRADVQRMIARSLVERKQYSRAAALLEGALKSSRLPSSLRSVPGEGISRQDLENRYLLALSYEGLKRYEDALAALLPVTDSAAGGLKADGQLEQGVLLSALKRYADAIPPFESFLNGKPTGEAEAKALGGLAIALARANRIDKAKQVYAELLAKYPKHPLIAPTTEHLAEAAYDANDTAWSAELSSWLAAAGNSAEYELKGKLNLGWSQFKAGKLAEAADTFDQLLKLSPPEPMAAEAALIRGHVLEQLGRSEPALAMYGMVIEKYPASPQHADALLAAARLHNNLKQWPEAVALCGRLAHDHPQFPKLDAALYEWAWGLLELGKAEDAQHVFERLHNEYPQSRFWADATCRMAQRAFDAKDYDRANRLIDALLPRQTDLQVRQCAMYLRGQVAVAKADWPKVRAAFEALVKEFSATNRRLAAETWIAEADYQRGDLTSASARLDQLTGQIQGKHEPWMALIPLRRAQILAKRDQWNDAYADRCHDRKGLSAVPTAVRRGLLVGTMSRHASRL